MRIVPPIILDRVSVDLGPWSGYHVLAQYLNKEKSENTPRMNLTLNQIFTSSHEWTATLSAEKSSIIIATGDVIPARSVNFMSWKNRNFMWPFEKISDTLKNADITLINLESPLIDNCPLTNSGMIFCGDKKHIEGLVFSGVDVANLANNHMTNQGYEGIISTRDLLNSRGIETIGLNNIAVKKIRDIRFAFLAYEDVEKTNVSISLAEDDKLSEEIKRSKTISDVVIVSFHWGIEYTTQPSERQRHLAHLAIDEGADFVIGNHPHWIQPVEIYKNKLITYAHGNLVFDQMWSEKTKLGIVGKYIFYEDKLIDVEFLPLKIINFGQPYFLEGEEKNKIIEDLNKESLILNSKNTN
ncbi:hypothetical protein COV53_04635 [Candidatus Gottesmanbacteria bacterium CG11_big_fil_rev_8_21_14_0_20_37_11]|uniref:Capsule synthesis protein CapA domain-containing protein n=1 Tax=Candidatus Gottesmanbacteria bacterium CG11_big_fil_rev_8_21_14_0_20_37_11 TaxID=1974575 RepID=A0A2H0NIV2_9BACT|nr:MAG: hypothetical protein COV53_04635 [Candidatus Gottesmanbacteria bacterium CG11_big_fil_rev_8_21_14_0_20_37_11]